MPRRPFTKEFKLVLGDRLGAGVDRAAHRAGLQPETAPLGPELPSAGGVRAVAAGALGPTASARGHDPPAAPSGSPLRQPGKHPARPTRWWH